MARRLAQEVGKKDPFRSATQEAYLNVVRTGQELEGQFKTLLRGRRLSPTTYNLLRILRGHHPAGCRCSTIRDQLVVRVPDVTRLVNRLIDAGLVTRATDPGDGRAVLIRITDAGMRVLEELDTPVLDMHRRQLGHLSDEELESLTRLLEKARDASG
jgi:DNA-binding MarR family transcriptional regulator